MRYGMDEVPLLLSLSFFSLSNMEKSVISPTPNSTEASKLTPDQFDQLMKDFSINSVNKVHLASHHLIIGHLFYPYAD